MSAETSAFDPNLRNQFHSGKWSITEHLKVPPRPKDSASKPKSTPKLITTIKYEGRIVFETTGVTAFVSAEEQVKKWINDGHSPKFIAGKCMADFGAGIRVSAALRSGKKDSPALIENLI